MLVHPLRHGLSFLFNSLGDDINGNI